MRYSGGGVIILIPTGMSATFKNGFSGNMLILSRQDLNIPRIFDDDDTDGNDVRPRAVPRLKAAADEPVAQQPIDVEEWVRGSAYYQMKKRQQKTAGQVKKKKLKAAK